MSRARDPLTPSSGSDPAQLRRRIWILAAAVALFAWVLFPLRTERLNPADRETLFRAPDAAGGIWDGERLASALGVLDETARRSYAWSEVTLDVLFPLLYATLLVLLLGQVWTHPKGSPRWISIWRILIVAVPVGAAVADLVENVALFLAARSPAWTSGGDLALALDRAAEVLTIAGRAKFVLIAFSLALIVAGLFFGGRLGRAVSLVWLARVPIVGLVVLLSLAALGGSDRVSPTNPNLLLLRGFLQAYLFASMAGVAAVVMGFTWTLLWERGPERVGGGDPGPLPGWLGRLEAGSIYRALPFLIFTVPLIVRALARSVAVESRPLLPLLTGALLGLGAAAAVVILVDLVRGRALGYFGRAESLVRLARPAPGYTDQNLRLYRGHGLAAVGALAGLIAYTVGNFALAPSITRAGPAAVPTIAYVFGLLAALVSVLAGATFFFDRWRMPLIGALAIWMAGAGLVHKITHEFPWNWQADALPTVGTAACNRLALQPEDDRVLTIVTATGGGIQAAAWTARVLTGIDLEVQRLGGPEDGGGFSRTIALISGVSGGSVGTYFALSAFGDHGGLPEGEEDLKKVVTAAEASSLEETAWGILFPDLRRAFNPCRDPIRDRGWAMERGWLRARINNLGGDPETIEGETLSDWVERTRKGLLPAVVFNATRIDDGLPLHLSTVGAADDEEGGLTADLRYGYDPGIDGYLDLATVTAARLSATFPYVSPITQPQDHDEPPERSLVRWNAADGGYFDNHGTTAALEWLKNLEAECHPCLANISKVVWLQIDSFPQSAEARTATQGGWTLSAFGPVFGLARVRTASQEVRRSQELGLLQRRLSDSLVVVTIAPPPRKPGLAHRGPPLSWYLSVRDRERIERDWGNKVATGEVKALVEIYKNVWSRSATP